MDAFGQYFGTGMLEKSLDAAALRQEVISNNIAHVNVAGYRPQSVLFEEKLKELCDQAQEDDPGSGGWPDAKTIADLQPEVQTKDGKVDMSREMTNLAKNQILYSALANKMSGYLSALKYVVDNSGH